jgi:hypothetical protein
MLTDFSKKLFKKSASTLSKRVFGFEPSEGPIHLLQPHASSFLLTVALTSVAFAFWILPLIITSSLDKAI